MPEVSKRGGAKVGMMNASYPLVKLRATPEKLYLNGGLLGNYEFAYDQIIKIDKYGWPAVLNRGIRIYHSVKEYPDKIIFYPVFGINQLINNICQVSNLKPESQKTSLEKAGEDEIISRNKYEKKFPVKVSYLVLAILVWNLLYFADIFMYCIPYNKFPGPLMILAIAGLFTVSILIKRNESFRNKILTEVSGFKRIENIVNLLLLVSGGLFLSFFIIFLISL